MEEGLNNFLLKGKIGPDFSTSTFFAKDQDKLKGAKTLSGETKLSPEMALPLAAGFEHLGRN